MPIGESPTDYEPLEEDSGINPDERMPTEILESDNLSEQYITFSRRTTRVCAMHLTGSPEALQGYLAGGDIPQVGQRYHFRCCYVTHEPFGNVSIGFDLVPVEDVEERASNVDR